ncbi:MULTISPECIES: hypothetical protein [Arthrobacter]|uniref:MtN3 and saliva related transmembrane protein n=2 Tax=Arthrobacter TaxID=1663 RepID=A0ABU9KNW1_9MICC|nr:hypothetical protein [Arthrobacter sp. YJM1]MDP5228609.1 hypothetical protein [Arthrobacter sp. YJM1]
MPDRLGVIAGAFSTIVFIASTLPMVAKAIRTRDLSSYSIGNLILGNAGNLLYSVYVLSLPFGPAWALHGFNTAVSVTMLVLWFRYRTVPRTHVAIPEGRTRSEVTSVLSGAPSI